MPSVPDPLVSERLCRQKEERKLQLSVGIGCVYSNREAFLGRGCLLCFHNAAASSLRSSRRPAEAPARCARGGGTEEKLFLKQPFTQETAFAAAQNSRRITDEALCRWDEINQTANEQYVNAMLY